MIRTISGKSVWTLLAGIAVLAMTVITASGQELPTTIDSIDAHILNSEIIVIGTVTDITTLSQSDADLTVSVESVLKGNPGSPFRFRLPYGEYYKKTPDRLLILLKGSGKPGRPDDVHFFTLVESKIGIIPKEDATIIQTPAELIDYVRNVVRKHPDVTSIPTFTLPKPERWKSETGFLASRQANSLVVPADSELERWALDAIHDAMTELRALGTSALRFFKSDENIAQVRPLLADSGYVVTKPAESNNGVELDTFPVRKEAVATFKFWNTPIDAPAITQETPRFRTVNVIHWKGVAQDADLQNLLDTEGIETLEFEYNAVSDAQLAIIGRIKTLQHLKIRGRVTDEGIKQLRDLTNLEYLDLSMSRLTDKGVKDLSRLEKLRSLVLAETRVTDSGLNTIVHWQNLNKVVLSLTHTTDDAVAQARRLRPDLEIINRPPMGPEWGTTTQTEMLAAYAFFGDAQTVGIMLDQRAPPNGLDFGGTAPLIYAASQNHDDVVLLLLNRRAQVDIQDSGNRTALQWASLHGNTVVMQLLLDRGANASHIDEDGNSALHLAAQAADAGSVRLLMTCGANPLLKNREGRTPIDIAESRGNKEILIELRNSLAGICRSNPSK